MKMSIYCNDTTNMFIRSSNYNESLDLWPR